MIEDLRIFSDGMVGKFPQDRNHFVGKDIDELFRRSLRDFAQTRIYSKEGIAYDYRLVNAPEHDLTPGLIDRYLVQRQIYHISILVDGQGRLASKYCWINPTQSLA